MGMPKYDISWLGNSRFRGFRRSKQPDECFFPTVNVDQEEWPALVIETGVSETLSQLHRDAIWWFRQSPNINYVLLVNVDRSQRTIHIEKWERCRPREPCITRSHTEAIPDPCPSETATISETGVTRTFTLSFRSLFKRPASERRELRLYFRRWMDEISELYYEGFIEVYMKAGTDKSKNQGLCAWRGHGPVGRCHSRYPQAWFGIWQFWLQVWT